MFGADTGPEPLSNLDTNYTLLVNSLNNLPSFANYYVDSSGAANSITVTVPAPQSFIYTAGLALQVRLANTNTATAVTINVNGFGVKTVLLDDGVAPPIGSLVVNSILDLMYDGTNFRIMSMRGSTTLVTGLFGDGAVGTPSISFSADPDTGLYRPAANTLAFAAGGAIAFTLTSTTNSSAHELGIQDGSVTLPGLFVASDTNTGLYSIAADDLAVTAGGLLIAQFRNVAGAAKFLGADGTVAAPYFTFDADPDTGIYRSSANAMSFASGGNETFRIDTAFGSLFWKQLRAVDDGVVGTPAYSFNNDTDTGFWRQGANSIGVSANGALAMVISATDVSVSGNSFTFGTLNSGVMTLNVTTTAGATAGGGALPATPRGFIACTINGTGRKIPYYDT